MDADARIEALEAENRRLRDRIEQLEGVAIRGFVPPVEWRLTASEARTLATLLERPECSKDAIMSALYRDDGREEPEMKIVDVFVCKLRKKLAPYGFPIQTIWGHGYKLAPETKAAVRAAMERAAA